MTDGEMLFKAMRLEASTKEMARMRIAIGVACIFAAAFMGAIGVVVYVTSV